MAIDKDDPARLTSAQAYEAADRFVVRHGSESWRRPPIRRYPGLRRCNRLKPGLAVFLITLQILGITLWTGDLDRWDNTLRSIRWQEY